MRTRWPPWYICVLFAHWMALAEKTKKFQFWSTQQTNYHLFACAVSLITICILIFLFKNTLFKRQPINFKCFVFDAKTEKNGTVNAKIRKSNCNSNRSKNVQFNFPNYPELVFTDQVFDDICWPQHPSQDYHQE